MAESGRLDAGTAARVIEAQFPVLRPVIVSYLGEGCDSTALEVNGRWVFRFPTRVEVEQQLLIELRLLPRLARASPVPLPDFCFHGQPQADFPRHFGGYPKLPGIPAIGVDPRDIPAATAASIGRFLSWLHSFPIDDASSLGVAEQDAGGSIEEAAADALSDLARVGDADAGWDVRSWRDYLEAVPQQGVPITRVMVHGDLAAEHFLYDHTTQAITGVIDWSEVAIGDPAVDLAALFHWGGSRLLESALSAYEKPNGKPTIIRARFLAACRGAADIAFGIETRRPEYVAAGARALAFCSGTGVPGRFGEIIRGLPSEDLS